MDGLLLLDKPKGITSNAALLEVRRLFQAQSAGHTGTLDPLASGLLPICLGQTSKLSAHLLNASKRYLATVQLGARTSTGDSEGEVIASSDPAGLKLEQLQAAAARFTGRISQVPPMYSAIKMDGLKLYNLARVGQHIAREPREVEIQLCQLISFEAGRAILDIRCSKGTYVRTLAEDWAASFGQAAHLAELQRLAVGDCEPAHRVTLAEINEAAWHGFARLDALLLPSQTLLSGWRFFEIDQAQIQELDFGRPVMPSAPLAAGPVALRNAQGRLMGLAEFSEDGRLLPRRWFGGIY